MTREDELFDKKIHDAYERVELSDDAQQRMLANLLAARDAKREHQVEASAEKEREAEVLRLPRRHGRWALLPVAAGLVAALAVVQIGTLAFRESESSHAIVVEVSKSEERSASEENVAYDAAEETDAAADMVASDAPQAVEGQVLDDEAKSTENGGALPSDLYSTVTMSDGTYFTVQSEQVDGSRIRRELGDAIASSSDGQQIAACTVYELVDGGHAVRFDEGDPYWLCD